MNKKELIKKLIEVKEKEANYEKYPCGSVERSKLVGMKNGINKALEMVEELEDIEEIEIPEIPEYLAEWIERKREFHSVYGLLRSLFVELEKNDLLIEWKKQVTEHDGNAVIQEIVAKAFLNGYTIKEQLYNVILPTGETRILSERIKDGYIFLSHVIDNGGDKVRKEFTEQEIKAIDERFWAFKKEVTK